MTGLIGTGHVASFIGHEPGRAVFVGLYTIDGATPQSFEEYRDFPAHVELTKLGMRGWQPDAGEQQSRLFFGLTLKEFYSDWFGKLVIDWPPPERSWWRRAERNTMRVLAVREESFFATSMPSWNELVLTHAELGVLPTLWRAALEQWRGIYFIHDAGDGKGYVGSAYGRENILGRWMNYADTGHGGNVLLRGREPQGMTFSILQRVSPDMDAAEVIRLEATWKERLHTRRPFGLNDN
jgi:hypothetical protein